MSLGYASKLSYRDDLGGQVGAKELQDTASEIRASRKVVVFTGAGISTACGIPDFRGPKGVWTLQKAGKPLPELSITFATARPSLTHMALVGLLRAGKVTFIVSQNVDGLHLRSGVPAAQLAELHGNCFAERCPRCAHKYVRDFEVETVGFKPTGRICAKPGCRGRLRDHVLDWEDALPKDELEAAEKAASAADLAICLGTSLQITPACNIPVLTTKAGGKLVIVNLQRTPKDKKAALIIRAKADDVMAQMMTHLQMHVPDFVREDSVLVIHRQLPFVNKANISGSNCILWIGSVHGITSAVPMVKDVAIKVNGTGGAFCPVLAQKKPAYSTEAMSLGPGDYCAELTLTLTADADADKQTVKLSYPFTVLAADQLKAALKQHCPYGPLTKGLVPSDGQVSAMTAQPCDGAPLAQEAVRRKKRRT